MKPSLLTLLSFCIVFPIVSLQAGDKSCKTDACGPKLSSKDRAAKLLKKFDANEDGKLDQAELSAMMDKCCDKSKNSDTQSSQIPKSALVAPQSKSSSDKSDCAAECLKKFDKNGDGKLSKKEIAAMLDSCGKCDKKPDRCGKDSSSCKKDSSGK